MANLSRNFVLQLGTLIALYVSVISLISLLFGVITLLYPDTAQFYWEHNSAQSSVRFSIAFLIVFFPTYVALSRMVNTMRRNGADEYTKFTLWLVYLSLLVCGITLLIDLVVTLNAFLQGDLTTRFILKSLSVLLVIGTASVYYYLDIKDYWNLHEKYSIYYASTVSVAIVLCIISGFIHIDSPAKAREISVDSKQISDLQEIQGRVESYVAIHDRLPDSISDAYDGLALPQQPENRSPYQYEISNQNAFKLCAQFETETKNQYTGYMGDMGTIKNANDWDHGTGNWCFTRIITKK